MRLFPLVFTLLAAQLVAQAAPRKVAKKSAVSLQKATPLPPEKLRGQIVFVRKGDLWVINPRTRAQTLILQGDNIWGFQHIDISPDLKSAAVGNPNGELKIYPLNGVKPRSYKIQASYPKPQEIDLKSWVHPGQVSQPRWSPDGTHLSYTLETAYIMGGPPKYSTEVRVMKADGTDDHHVAGTTSPSGPAAHGAVWSRDGKRLLFDFYPGSIDQPDSAPPKFEQHTAAIDGADMQPFDGKITRFASPRVSRDEKKWLQVDRVENTEILRIYKTPAASIPASVPFFESLAYQIGGFEIYEQQLTFSPDGRQTLFGGALNPAFINK